MTSNPPALSIAPVQPCGMVVAGIAVPSLYASMGEEAAVRVAEFFAAQIRNPNTRRAYLRAVNHFSDFCPIKKPSTVPGFLFNGDPL